MVVQQIVSGTPHVRFPYIKPGELHNLEGVPKVADAPVDALEHALTKVLCQGLDSPLRRAMMEIGCSDIVDLFSCMTHGTSDFLAQLSYCEDDGTIAPVPTFEVDLLIAFVLYVRKLEEQRGIGLLSWAYRDWNQLSRGDFEEFLETTDVFHRNWMTEHLQFVGDGSNEADVMYFSSEKLFRQRTANEKFWRFDTSSVDEDYADHPSEDSESALSSISTFVEDIESVLDGALESVSIAFDAVDDMWKSVADGKCEGDDTIDFATNQLNDGTNDQTIASIRSGAAKDEVSVGLETCTSPEDITVVANINFDDHDNLLPARTRTQDISKLQPSIQTNTSDRRKGSDLIFTATEVALDKEYDPGPPCAQHSADAKCERDDFSAPRAYDQSSDGSKPKRYVEDDIFLLCTLGSDIGWPYAVGEAG